MQSSQPEVMKERVSVYTMDHSRNVAGMPIVLLALVRFSNEL